MMGQCTAGTHSPADWLTAGVDKPGPACLLHHLHCFKAFKVQVATYMYVRVIITQRLRHCAASTYQSGMSVVFAAVVVLSRCNLPQSC